MRTGDQAVGFQLATAPGEMVDVAPHIGSDRVVLLFFPFSFSPVCTDEMCAMRDHWQQWAEMDAKVFGITCDSPFVTAKFRQELDVPFPILSDFNGEVSRQFDAQHAELAGMKNVPKRSVFVIDESGSIVYDWVSEDPKVMPDLDAVRNAVAALNPV